MATPIKRNPILDKLTVEEKEAVYREVLAQYTKQDILVRAEDYFGMDISDEEAEFLAERWAYDGEYDCNLSYWDNIDNLLKLKEEK